MSAALLAALLAAGASVPAEPIVVGRFQLQTRPWVNLHQRLMYAARFEPADPVGMSPAERAAWHEAVSAYRSVVGNRVPFQDAGLMAIQASLSAAPDEELPAELPDAARAALLKAAPVYRSRQWPVDEPINRFWISMAVPQLASAGEELMEAHARVYGTPMPQTVIVDVASHGWQFGAYTVGDSRRAHTVLSSLDPAYAGFAATEMLLHEASHAVVGARDGAIGSDLAKASRELGIPVPPNLWHAIQFLTSGELARRALQARGVAEYARVVDRGMWERGFARFREPLETHWIAVLDGRLTREEAVRRILRALAPPSPAP
jgi:hypothetical protein